MHVPPSVHLRCCYDDGKRKANGKIGNSSIYKRSPRSNLWTVDHGRRGKDSFLVPFYLFDII